jgi:signal transduction histidine kinase
VTAVAASPPRFAAHRWRRSARAIDGGLALAAFGATTAFLASGGIHGGHGFDVLALALSALSTLPLLIWRRGPLAVLAFTTAASAALNVLGYPVGPPFGPTLALYLLAQSRSEAAPWTRRTTGAVAGLVIVHASAAGIGSSQFPAAPLAYASLVWTIAWFAGDRARLRRERIAALEERALRAEREAERERRLATAEERTRIARDLHDSAGHAINVILVQAGAARLLYDSDRGASRAALETIEDVARQTVGEIEQLVRTLRDDEPLDAQPGVAAVPTLVARHPGAALELAGTPRPLPAAVGQAAYRIVQEALTNTARHGSGPARVRVEFAADALELAVRNPIAHAAPAAEGHGLIGMRERAALLGGTLVAGPGGAEFVVRARLPFPDR